MEKHPEFEESLNEVSLSFLEEFWDSVLSFLKSAVNEMKQYFPLDKSSVFIRLDCLSLKDMLRIKKILQFLGKHFYNIIFDEEFIIFNNEIERLTCNAKEICERIRNASSFIEVWKQEKETYPLIFRLAQSIQVFPYSTVSI